MAVQIIIQLQQVTYFFNNSKLVFCYALFIQLYNFRLYKSLCLCFRFKVVCSNPSWNQIQMLSHFTHFLANFEHNLSLLSARESSVISSKARMTIMHFSVLFQQSDCFQPTGLQPIQGHHIQELIGSNNHSPSSFNTTSSRCQDK